MHLMMPEVSEALLLILMSIDTACTGASVVSLNEYKRYCRDTEAELRKFHRSYGHQPSGRIIAALQEAGFDDLSEDTKEKLDDIARHCDPCQRHRQKPRHFSVFLKWQGMRYNYVLIVDIAHFQDGAVVHIIDAATGYNAARFTPSRINPPGKEVWAIIRDAWINTYVGAPDVLRFDAGTNVTSAFIQTACALNGIRFEAIPVEAPWRIGALERAHAPLEKAYDMLKQDLDLSREELLQMAVKVVNDSVGVSGVSPTMHVFGSAARHFPALSKHAATTHAERMEAMTRCQSVVERFKAQQSVARAAKHPGPYRSEDTLHTGEEVMVYRKDGGWIGPWLLIGLTEADGSVKNPKTGSVTTLERTSIRPYVLPYPDEAGFLEAYREIVRGTPDLTLGDSSGDDGTTPSTLPTLADDPDGAAMPDIVDNLEEPSPPGLPFDLGGTPDESVEAFVATSSNAIKSEDLVVLHPDNFLHDVDELFALETQVYPPAPGNAKRFKASRRAEMEGLLEANIFASMPRAEAIAHGDRIFKSRFVNTVKNAGTPRALDKCRFVLCGYNDSGSKGLMTKAPTVSKNSTRMFASIAASCPKHLVKVRDITQAFARAKTLVQRRVVCEPPKELNLPAGTVLVIVRPLYGLSEAALHWYLTYRTHHIDSLDMKSTILDSCFFFKRSDSSLTPDGLVALQVDDSCICGTAAFHALEDEKVKEFPCKQAIPILAGKTPTEFNGVEIRLRESGEYVLSSHSRCAAMDTGVTAEDFLSKRALMAYIALWSRPLQLGRIQILASKAKEPSSSDIKELKRIQEELMTNHDELVYRKQDLSTVKIVCFTDAGYATHNDDSHSQLGYVIAMVDNANVANVIAYASRRCRRVTRSVLASELLALVAGYDMAASLATQLGEILGRTIPVWCIIDSKTVFNVVTRLGSVTEKRLMPDVSDLREEHLAQRLRLFWGPSSENCADPFTKMRGSCAALNRLLSGVFDFHPEAWVETAAERTLDPVMQML